MSATISNAEGSGHRRALPFLSARARCGSRFTCDPGFGTIDAMDLAQWVEEAESLLRCDGLWPEQDAERARGVLEDAALEGPESLIRAMRTLRRELRAGGWHRVNPLSNESSIGCFGRSVFPECRL